MIPLPRTNCCYNKASEFFDIEQNDSAGLLDPEEHQYFSDGLENYYQHVINLFETIKAHLYVVEFSQLALLALKASQKEVSFCRSLCPHDLSVMEMAL